MIPKDDLVMIVLNLFDRKNRRQTYTRIHKTVFLVDRKLRERTGQGTGYKFDSFMSHGGPYDPELQRDLDVLLTLGEIHNDLEKYESTNPKINILTHNVQTSRGGERYVKFGAMPRLEKRLGNPKDLKWLHDLICSYHQKEEQELILESVKLWKEEYKEREAEVKKFFSEV